jgi:uncharacterized UBP type Zn finger protein
VTYEKLPLKPLATLCMHQSSDRSSQPTAARPKDETQGDESCPGTENWLCLECGKICCSRYVSGHALTHWEETKTADDESSVGHCLNVSLSDLSVWCYCCGAYVRHPSLTPITKELEHRKFEGPESKDSSGKGPFPQAE